MNFTNKIKKFLISPKTVISLIIITLVACLIGFFIPQITDKSPSYFALWKERSPYTFRIVDRLQLNRVYTSFWFLSLVVFMTVALGYSLYSQIKKNIQPKSPHPPFTQHRTGAGFTKGGLEGIIREKVKLSEQIMRTFKKRRYRLSGFYSENQQLVFTKNSIGRWSGVIFHLGLLLVIMSAITVLCFQKRGFVQLIEGDLFNGKENNFLVNNKGVFAGEFDTGFKTHLSKITHSYWEKGELKFLESAVTIIKGKETINNKLSINNPLLINDTNIYQSYDYGYTLSFVLKKPSGEEVVSHFNIDRAPTVYKPAIGKTDFPTTFYIFKMKFYPDVTNKSFYLTKPIVYLTVFEKETFMSQRDTKDNENNPPSPPFAKGGMGGLSEEKVVFDGLIIPGNAIKIKEDILYFADTRYWSGLTFVKNPGMFIAYIGFTIGILGCALMFLFPYKEIYLTLNTETGLYNITGTTKRYHAIFKEEMDEIKKEIVTMSNP